MAGRLVSGRDFGIVVAAHRLRMLADHPTLAPLAAQISAAAAQAVDSSDGAVGLAVLRAATVTLARILAETYALLRDEVIINGAFDEIAAEVAACRREIDALAACLRRRSWLRLTSGGSWAFVP